MTEKRVEKSLGYGDEGLANTWHTYCYPPFQHPWQTLLVDHLSLFENLDASSGSVSRPACWGIFNDFEVGPGIEIPEKAGLNPSFATYLL